MTERRLLSNLLTQMSTHGQPPDVWGTTDIPEEELQAILAAGRIAPSADNAQTWRFITVKAHHTREALSQTVPETLTSTICSAPLIIVACGIRWIVTRVRREQPFAIIDVPIAVTHMLLQAEELGISCAWTLEFDEPKVKEILEIPQDVRVVALIALGKPSEK